MKDFSSLDLRFLVKEFQVLLNAKVEQIYQASEEFLIQFHIPGSGKAFLRLVAGTLIYLASAKPVVPDRPPSFCLYMRRQLKNARLRSIEQVGFERVLKLVFETKEKSFHLYLEIFSKGNIILCDVEDKVLSATSYQEWKDRSIKRNQLYHSPTRDIDIISEAEDSLTKSLTNSDKESIVKSLAIDFGLGGKFSEEVCARVGIDKSLPVKGLSAEELESVVKETKLLLDSQADPKVVFKDGIAFDIIPFALKAYKDVLSRDFESFNEAFDSVYTEKIHKQQIIQTQNSSDKKISRVQQILDEQEQRISGLEKSEVQNQKKGEAIYENYAKVQEILDTINEQKKEYSLNEIAAVLKKNKVITSLDEKTGDVVIEL